MPRLPSIADLVAFLRGFLSGPARTRPAYQPEPVLPSLTPAPARAARSAPVAIHTRGLTKFYGKVRGIEDLNLEVGAGEIFGFLGPNGAGKTTTLRLLLDFIHPTRGHAFVLGQETHAHSLELRRRIGYLPGETALYEEMTGHELLSLLSRLHGGNHEPRRQALAKRLDIDLSRPLRGLSHGMKQKVSIIAAFQHDPELVLLDEPTLGLDPLVQREFYDLLREEQAQGKTFLMSSHILPEVERVCDRVGIVRAGRLVAVEEIADLRHKKVRRMEVTFAAEVASSSLQVEGVDLLRQNGRVFELAVHGNVDALVKHLARFPIADLEFPEATLEDTFLQYYGGDAQ